MAYDTDLADRIRASIPFAVEHTEKAMFGGLAFLVGGHMAVVASGQGGIMLRCEPADTDRLRRSPGTGPMVMKGKELDGWLRVDADHVRTARQLARWVGIGVAYTSALPPKATKKARPRR
jgi:hypothetical protein